MRLLLDTSVLLWWLAENAKLGPRARATIADPDTEVFVSSASAWEISLKRASGKLDASFDIARELELDYFLELPIEVVHAVEAGGLPLHHKDPFDRMLVAQARLEDLMLVSSDTELGMYDVQLLDARV